MHCLFFVKQLAKKNLKKLVHINIKIKKLVTGYSTNTQTFEAFRNCNQGKTVVLCGSGPSLHKYKPFPHALHCSLNRAFENQNIKFDYLFACDWNGIKVNQEKFGNYPAIKFCGIGMLNRAERIPANYIKKHLLNPFCLHQVWTDIVESTDFEYNISHAPVVIGNSVAIPAMQFLLWTNPAKIYIVGCDCAPTGHFCSMTPEFEKIYKNSIQHNCYSRQLADWTALKQFAARYYPQTKIFSVNPIGLKGLFTDIFI